MKFSQSHRGSSMFIQTETTPNPATLKFLPGRAVLKGAPRDFRDAGAAADASPLAAKLFEIDNIAGVFLGSDFVAVTKNGGEWQHLKPAILGTIMEHFLSGEPALFASNGAAASDEEYDDKDAEIVAQIKELLETRVRPAVANDGGDIVFHGYNAGTVYLKMRGACSGCPSATATLRNGIENLLKHFIPEVETVQAV
jgi:Fe-S cluster biogenesis protein NfuA